MDDRLLSSLSPQQREAVLHEDGPCLVLAGAGSGKTRVLTHRVAFLVGRKGISPGRILAVTFTNKAAGEMKKRVLSLIKDVKGDLWISTFHSFCVKVLRRWGKKLGIDPNFSIYDRDDQRSLVKACADELGIDTRRFQVGTLINAISGAKNRLLTPEMVLEGENTFFGEVVGRVYMLYQKKLRELNALDFDDLLFEVLRSFEEHEEILDYYRRLFVHILVDEFQDTNRVQYLLLKKLSEPRRNVFVVGDDDQSIYGWRGAEVRNILDFPKDFPGTRIIKLEENYRSTKNILIAASTVIKMNKSRWDKDLFTKREDGEPVYIHGALDEHDEARFVGEEILKLSGRYRLNDIAVLYRVNAQSRVFEEEFLKMGIPHRIVGGVKFYERKEIKDIIAYLRFIANPRDEVSFLRIVNVPPRGIGKGTILKFQEEAERREMPISLAFLEMYGEVLKGKVLERAERLIELLKLKDEDIPISELVERVLRITGYREYIEGMGRDELYRLENIQEFLSVAKEFEDIHPDAKLQDFLEFLGLMTDIDTYNERDDRVTLMTIHSSKGLEFPVVFVTGLEEGLFPLNMRFYDQVHVGDPEEETRLCYVAMTRAKDILYLTYAEERLIFGRTFYNEPSRFIKRLSGKNICYISEGEGSWFQSR